MNASDPFFDDLELLQVMLRLHNQRRLPQLTGDQLMQEMGSAAGDDADRAAFVRTLHVAAEDDLIGFEPIQPLGLSSPLRPEEYQYVANLTRFRLRTKGRDRARGLRIIEPLPEPGLDDGRRIPTRVIERVAVAVAANLKGPEVVSFLVDSGIPAEHCPPIGPAVDETVYVRTVLLMLLGRGASGRRVVRSFIGAWLDDDLEVGPMPTDCDAILRDLSRMGWHLNDGVLVIGAKLKPGRRADAELVNDETPDPAKARRVMVVYGRDDTASGAMFDYLRTLKLEPLEWGQLVRATESGAPYTGQVLDRALEVVQAVVVFFTPDDEARLRSHLVRTDESPGERKLRGQPRPNVPFEAGLAFGRHPKRTILVELGPLRGVSDLFGRHAVRLGSTPEPLHDLAGRLKTAGCAVDTSGSQWLNPQRFRLTTPPPLAPKGAPTALGGSLVQDLTHLVTAAPADAVLEAHAQLARELSTVLGPTHRPDDSADLRGLARLALDQGLITPETATAIEGVTTLRNLAAVPGRRHEVTSERAAEYLVLIDGVMFAIRQGARSAASP